MSSWYTKMYKSHEVARQRDKREQRRMDLDRHGPNFVAKYQLSLLDKEKRMIEKELERIRKGIHKQPRLSDFDRLKEHDVTGGLLNSEHGVHDSPKTIDTGHSKEENKLFDAMLFLQNNPSALVPLVSAHGDSEAYLETLERVSPVFPWGDKQPFVPKYLRERGPMDKTEKSAMLEKYKFLLQSHSPELWHNNSQLDRRKNKHLRDMETSSLDSLERDRRTPNGTLIGEPHPTSSRTPRNLDLHELANGGMENAHNNAQRRLSEKGGDKDAPKRKSSVSESESNSGDSIARTGQATPLFHNPEYCHPDGTLLTRYTVESLDKSMVKARNTRYVRTRETREMDRELGLDEIFDKKK